MAETARRQVTLQPQAWREGQLVPSRGGRPPVLGMSSRAGCARPAGPAANAVRMFAVAAWMARRTAGGAGAGHPAASGRLHTQSSVPESKTPAPLAAV